jgi:hypothetical protein
MNVNALSGQMQAMTTTGASPIAGGRFDGQWQSAMNQTSSLLQMSRTQLDATVNAGSNLSSVAAGQGIGKDQLMNTIKQGLLDAGSQLSGNRLDNIASRIAHHRHHKNHLGAATPLAPSSAITSSGPAARPSGAADSSGSSGSTFSVGL